MGFGVFGKLPQKRDFVALGIPRGILEPFETWLQSAVAASRSDLGREWQERYLVAPVWRFWIGQAIMGQACAGVLIPSVDGVGRFFPLSLLYAAEEGEALMPPVFAPLDGWFAALEARLVSVLNPEAGIVVEQLTEGLEGPPLADAGPEPRGLEFRRGCVWHAADGLADDLLSALIAPDYWMSMAGKSFWWTNGGSASGPLVYTRNALPDPFFFSSMLRGDTV